MHSTKEHIIGLFKRVQQTGVLTHYLKKLFVRNCDQRIHVLLELLKPLICNSKTLTTLKTERTCHHSNSKNAHVACDLGNDWCTTRARTATHTGGNKYHVGALKRLSDAITIFQCRSAADLGVCACAQALSDVVTQLQNSPRIDIRKCLRIRVGADEVHALDVVLDHVTNSVTATTTDSDDFDYRVLRCVIY